MKSEIRVSSQNAAKKGEWKDPDNVNYSHLRTTMESKSTKKIKL